MYLIDQHIETFSSPHGSRVIVVPINSAQSITAMVVVIAGPRYDEFGKEGTAHLIEHLKTQEANGDRSEIRGFTYFETVRYWISFLPDDLQKYMKALTRFLHVKTYSSKTIELEKKRIAEEISIIQTNTQKQIWELWTKTVFSKSPLGRGYIGTSGSIAQIKKDEVCDFISRFYVPENFTFILSGRIDTRDKEKILHSVHSLTEGSIDQHSLATYEFKKQPVKNQGLTVLVQYKDSKTVALICGFVTMRLSTIDYASLLLIGRYLVGNNSGILSSILFSKFGIYSIQTTVARLSDCGYFSFYFYSPRALVTNVLDKIRSELKKVINENIDKRLLEKAKKMLIVEQITVHDNPEKISLYYARQHFLEKNFLLTQKDMIDACSALRQDDLQATARKIFQKENFRIAAVGQLENELSSFTF